MDERVTNGLTRHWVSIVDERGRERLEARWTSPQTAVSAAQAA